jgi:hypothetical protein
MEVSHLQTWVNIKSGTPMPLPAFENTSSFLDLTPQSMWILHWLQEPNKYMGLCQMVENFIQLSYELLKTTTYIGSSIRESIPPLVYSIGRINLLLIWELIMWTHWVIQALWYRIISFERSYLGCALSKMIIWLIKSKYNYMLPKLRWHFWQPTTVIYCCCCCDNFLRFCPALKIALDSSIRHLLSVSGLFIYDAHTESAGGGAWIQWPGIRLPHTWWALGKLQTNLNLC